MKKKPLLKTHFYVIAMYRRNKLIYRKEISDFGTLISIYNAVGEIAGKKEDYQVEFSLKTVCSNNYTVMETWEVKSIIEAQQIILKRTR